MAFYSFILKNDVDILPETSNVFNTSLKLKKVN